MKRNPRAGGARVPVSLGGERPSFSPDEANRQRLAVWPCPGGYRAVIIAEGGRLISGSKLARTRAEAMLIAWRTSASSGLLLDPALVGERRAA